MSFGHISKEKIVPLPPMPIFKQVIIQYLCEVTHNKHALPFSETNKPILMDLKPPLINKVLPFYDSWQLIMN